MVGECITRRCATWYYIYTRMSVVSNRARHSARRRTLFVFTMHWQHEPQTTSRSSMCFGCRQLIGRSLCSRPGLSYGRCPSVFTVSGIASKNATQIDPPCDSKCHVCCTYVRYKKQKLFDKNTQYHGGWQWIKNSVIHSSILVSSIRILLARHFQFLTRLSNTQSVKG